MSDLHQQAGAGPTPRVPTPAPQLSASEIRLLAERVLHTRVDELVPLAGSVGNQNVRLDTPRGAYALKLASSNEIAAERWGLERAATAGVPVPRVAATGALADERAFLVTDWLRGRPAATGTDTDALVEAGRAVRRLHRVTGQGYGRVDVTANGGRGRHESWAAVVDGIVAEVDDLVRHDVISVAVARRVRAAVADHLDLISYSGDGVLLHCDLKPAHVFVADGRLAAIIDWGDTSYGDPRWDLARLRQSGDAVFVPVLDGYAREDREIVRAGLGPAVLPGRVEQGSEFDRSTACLSAILRIDALHYELMAGGDWFDAYRATIYEWLESLTSATPLVEVGRPCHPTRTATRAGTD